ncbi:hypothetical protein CLU84_2446 [Comamonas sp. 26]|nr:hypothetical protein CLU84_2446 [Comamonas sp. 26]
MPSSCHIAEARYASLGQVVALKDVLIPGANSKALASIAGAFPFVCCQPRWHGHRPLFLAVASSNSSAAPHFGPRVTVAFPSDLSTGV